MPKSVDFFFFTSFRNCTIISSNIATASFSFLLVGFQSHVVRSSGLVHKYYTLCYPFFFSFLKFFVHFRFFSAVGGLCVYFFVGGMFLRVGASFWSRSVDPSF